MKTKKKKTYNSNKTLFKTSTAYNINDSQCLSGGKKGETN